MRSLPGTTFPSQTSRFDQKQSTAGSRSRPSERHSASETAVDKRDGLIKVNHSDLTGAMIW
jgi:hypothetical protein